MSSSVPPFKAYVIRQDENRKVSAAMEPLSVDGLDAGEVLIKVAYSSVNYKDALAATGAGKIIRRFPCVGGIDLSGVVEQFGTGAAAETRSYDPLLERVVPGSCWQFRLTANPTRSKKDSADHMARGTLKPCYLEVEQEEWLWAQAAKHGFAVSEGSFAVTRKQTYHFKKNGTRPVTLLVVTYEGILQVTDPEAFKALVDQAEKALAA